MTQQPAGWYNQPDGTRRYWDGSRWTEHTAPPPGQQPLAPSPQPARPQDSGPASPLQPGGTPGPVGGSTKKPIWQKKRFIIPAAVVVALIGIGSLGQGKTSPNTPASPATTSPSASSTTSTETEAADTQAPEVFTMPDLVGKGLQEAQDELQALGSHRLDQKDASGRGRALINDSNWKVCEQEPAAGQEVPMSTTVALSAVKNSETCPGSGTESPESEEPTEKAAGIGDTVRVGDLSVKVTSAERKSKLSSVFSSKKGHWMLVTVKITNKGKDQVMVNSSDFTLIEPDGTTYATDSDGIKYIDSDDWLFLKKINPKTSATGKILFALPKSAKNLTLQVSTGLLGLETADISLGKK
jgi:hypothetical protein